MKKSRNNWKWCTYSWYNKELPQYIGKAYNISQSSCDILYSEDQLYGKESWNNNYVMFFGSLEEAICYMYTFSNLKYLSEIKEMVYNKFSKDAKNVSWECVLRPLKIQKVLKNVTK